VHEIVDGKSRPGIDLGVVGRGRLEERTGGGVKSISAPPPYNQR